MIQKDKVATVVITLSIALAIGHFMQRGSAAAARIEPEKVDAHEIERALSSALPIAPQVVADVSSLALENQSVPLVYAAANSTLLDRVLTLSDAPTVGFSLACDVAFEATPQENAMVRLSFSANCLGEAPVTVHHNGLHFTQFTDEDGTFDIAVPALSKSADYTVELPDGDTQTARADVFTADGFARIAIVWNGSPDLYLHAFENGAAFDDPGHIWALAPSSLERFSSGESGFLASYGSSNAQATHAQVYSHAVDWTGQGDDVEFMVEVEVSDASCGQALTGALIQSDGLTVSEPVGFSVQLPDCDAVGGYIQLKNVVEGLTLSQS
ncbi:hypothetical protein [Celeribacter sp.]|uniref:hypothetical protein n=1 Tax=Celeribacter sp. TaxID=1890673 RepID=UPI003A8F29D2